MRFTLSLLFSLLFLGRLQRAVTYSIIPQTLECTNDNISVPDASLMLAKFKNSLHSTKFLYIGDSTMREPFFSLCAHILKGVWVRENSHLAPFRGTCDLSHMNSWMEFYGYGQAGSWKATQEPSFIKLWTDKIDALRPNDVLIFTAGLHWIEQTKEQSIANNNNPVPSYIAAFDRLLTLLKLNDCSNKTTTVLWRETTPQHFLTSNGHNPMFNSTVSKEQCAPNMTLAMQRGQALGDGRCDPNCLPANWINEVASKLLNKVACTKIHTVKLWYELACFGGEHKPLYSDCTHWTPLVDVAINGKILETLALARGIREPWDDKMRSTP